MSDQEESGRGRSPEEPGAAEDPDRAERSAGTEDPTGTEEPTGGEESDGAEESDRSGTPDGSDVRKPISVRDLMPSPPSRPQRRAPEPSGHARRPAPVDPSERPEPSEAAEHPDREEDEPASAASDSDEERVDPDGSTPTPVRVAMDRTPPAAESAEASAHAADEAIPRTFAAEGEEWMVQVSGRSISGSWPDAGAPLMQLAFYRPMDPDFPRRELLTVERPLDALYDEDLRELLARARPTRRGEGDGS